MSIALPYSQKGPTNSRVHLHTVEADAVVIEDEDEDEEEEEEEEEEVAVAMQTPPFWHTIESQGLVGVLVRMLSQRVPVKGVVQLQL